MGIDRSSQFSTIRRTITPGKRNELLLRSSATIAFLLLFLSSKPAHCESLPETRRKIAIAPKTPRDGINSGLVIAYGQRIKGPYSVELHGGKIFVNNVQVIPSMADEKFTRAAPPAINEDSIEWKIANSIQATVTTIQTMARRGDSPREILSFAKQQPHIKEATLHEANAMNITREDGSAMLIMLAQKGSVKLSASELKSRSIAAAQTRAESVRHDLLKNRCIIFVDGGISTQFLSKEFPSAIPRIMDDRITSIEEKFSSLRGMMVESAARDVLANYKPEAWK